MRPHTLRPLLSKALIHAAVLLLVAGVTLPLFLLRGQLSTSTVAMLYLLPVLLSAILWGLTPGLLAGFFAFFAFNYFFLLPYYTLAVSETQEFTTLVIFFFVAVLISQLVGRAKRSLLDARQREGELTQLYELNRALAGANQMDDVLRVLADQLKQTFQAQAVRLVAEAPAGENGEPAGTYPKIEFLLGEAPGPGLQRASTPLLSSRGPFGEIEMWRQEPLLEVEELLLRTFAAQGALALERARLSLTETRAKILEESDRLKSILLSSVSHELRTPLATIKASVTSLLDYQVDWIPEARQDLLAVIDEESDHLNHLVGNLLDMTRIEAGALKPNKQWNIISEIIHRVVSQFHRSLGEHQVIIDAPDNLPLTPVDAIQMEQVFKNLLSNSVKYSPPGLPVQIRVWAEERETLQVQVINQGPPVPPDDLDRIFDKFYRIQHADKVSGTGLGLSICKGIIEIHGGQIWAENLPEGFSFRFWLPLVMDGNPPPVVESENL